MAQVSFGLIPLMIFPILFYLSFRWPKPKEEVPDISQVGWVRRFPAFLIDANVAMFGVLPFTCMPILMLEYLATGHWVWSFDRDYFRTSDILSALITVLGIFGFVYYWIWHFKKKKQTFGQRILKFSQ